MIQIQIDKTRAECADLAELVFFCQSSGFAQHVDTVKKLHRLADNAPFTWVSNYRPFSSNTGALVYVRVFHP